MKTALTLIFLLLIVFPKEKIKIYSYIPYPEIKEIISYHIEKNKSSKLLSLFDIYYQNVDNIVNFDRILKTEEIDILIIPIILRDIVKKHKVIRTWDEYFKNAPTFLAVYKTYTFDFMKSMSYKQESVQFLPFFSYSFYYRELFPNVKHLNIIEFMSFYNGLIYTTDYVAFYNTYMRKTRADSYLYSSIGQIKFENARIFSISDGLVHMDPPFVLYGIFLTSNPTNISKIRAIDFMATRIWDFETQIDLSLRIGVLASDKNTTLHPEYIQKVKDRRFALYYNNQLGKLKDYELDYNLFNNFYHILFTTGSNDAILYLDSYLKSLLYDPDFLVYNYQKLVQKNNFKNYLIAVFNDQENKKVEKFLYTPEFAKKTYRVFQRKRLNKDKKEVKEYLDIPVRDIVYLILNEEKKLRDIEGYKLKYQKSDFFSLVHESKTGKVLFLRRKTPRYSLVVVAE